MSDRSPSPTNSVEAFAEGRRRERTNTLDSTAAREEIALATLSRDATDKSPVPPGIADYADVPVIIDDDAQSAISEPMNPPYYPKQDPPVIDYEALQEFAAKKSEEEGLHSETSSVGTPRNMTIRSSLLSLSSYEDHDAAMRDPDSHKLDCAEKGLINRSHLKKKKGDTRFVYFSPVIERTMHTADFSGLLKDDSSIRKLFPSNQDAAAWWLDISRPSKDEMEAIGNGFGLHPLTTEDITTKEDREKVELFSHYYFVCFRSFCQNPESEEYLEPINIYMVVFRQGILTFSFDQNPHAHNVRRRMSRLRDYKSVSSDWVCYAMIDDIVDSFKPVMHEVERQAATVEDEVFTARMENSMQLLPQIGTLRKTVMSLMRLLSGKADVLKGFMKRCNDQFKGTPSSDIRLYLDDIQDHIVTMSFNLAHLEKMLGRTHGNYLASLSVESIMTGNKVNKALTKITLLATILVPLNMISSLFGMNVRVPGQDVENLGWFFGIAGFIVLTIFVGLCLARRYKLV